MKQICETKGGRQSFTISSSVVSELSRRIQMDISFIRENLGVITEEYEEKLVCDIERFFFDDIAKEIRLSFYDPLQSNRVFMEYCYKIAQFSTVFSDNTSDHNINIPAMPETCLFDIFVYFTKRFASLNRESQKELLKDYNIDWYDLNFSLQYSKKNKRRKTGAIDSKGLSIDRYIYEFSMSYNADISFEGNDLSSFAIGSDHRTGKSERDLREAIRCGEKLHYVIYKDMDSAIESIAYVLHQYNKIPIRWSLSRGFTIDRSYSYEVSDITYMNDIRQPVAALNFIIDNVEERVSYIFEDFHHHIGMAHVFNTTVAEIRSLIRDIARVLRERDEFVFFLSPSDSLPIELIPVFHMVKQEIGKGASFFNRYGYNMTDAALCKKNKPLIRRDDKIKRVIQILCQMEINNPILVGGAGVGKTAIVEGLASEIVRGNVPNILKGKILFFLNLNTLVAGSRYRGDFEERIKRLMEEVQAHSRGLIVFIDEIHTLLGAGSAEGAAGAEDILKPALARGDFPCIGATTYEGYECLIQDKALARRFQRIDIQPATVKEAEEILLGVVRTFEKHHQVKIVDDAIRIAVRLSEEYIHDQFLPGKAIRLLDSTSAFVKLEGRQTVCGKDIEGEIKRMVGDRCNLI